MPDEELLLRVTRLEEGQKRLEEGQKRLEEGQKRLEESYKRLEEGQAALREHVARLNGEVSQMSKRLDDLRAFIAVGFTILALLISVALPLILRFLIITP